MNESGRVMGLAPWLPWPLRGWAWWREAVPAQRLAAFRIGLAAILFLDIWTTYRPHLYDFFGPGSLATSPSGAVGLQWSIFSCPLIPWADQPVFMSIALGVWLAATAGLFVGWRTRTCAVVTWILSTSFANLNPHIDNAGDSVRGIGLFYLMLCPSGAAWSLDDWIDRRRGRRTGTILVHPWPLRLLFVQLVLIYFCNGLYKLGGPEWWRGDSLYLVLADLTLARFSLDQLPGQFLLVPLTWAILIWELGFPIWMVFRPSRRVALWFGAAFHLGTLLTLELGFFGLYMLALYLPLLPGERRNAPLPVPPPS